MGGGGAALAILRPPHDERQRAQAGDDYRHHEETVFKAYRVGLALHGKVGHRQRLPAGHGSVVALQDEHRRKALQILAEILVA